MGQTAAISASLVQIAGRMGQDHLEYPSLTRDLPLRQAYADWLGDQALGTFTAEDVALTLAGRMA